MTDAATTTQRPAGVPAAARSTEPSVATKVRQAAVEAAEGVPGVHHLGSPTGRALVRAMGRVPGGRTFYGPGVSVEVGERKAAVDVSLVIEHGSPAPAVGEQVRETVLERVKSASGLEVVEVNVNVVGLHHPDDDVPVEPVAAVDPADATTAADAAAVGTDDVREAGEEVKRIVAQAVEDGSPDADADAKPADSAEREGDEGGSPTVVLAVDPDEKGPDVVVAEQVVLADSVVVVDRDSDEAAATSNDGIDDGSANHATHDGAHERQD